MNSLMEINKMSAVELHREIMNNGNLAASSLLEMARCLKVMRDEKKYIDLGYNKFDDYCVDMIGMHQRNAYNYISAYERLGADVLQSNANLGIIKLELISHLPPDERDELLADPTEIEGMTIPQIKNLIAEHKEATAQLRLFDTNDKSREKEIKELKKSIKKNQDELADKEKRIKELTDTPVTVVKDLSEERIEDIQNEIKSEYESKISALERKLQLSDNDTVTIKFYFDNVKSEIQRTMETIENMSPENRNKYFPAFKKLLQFYIDNLGDDDDDINKEI
jgi:Uncharacterized conserved protein